MITADSDEGREIAERLQAEVERLHAFIAAWFRGEVAQDRAAFDHALTRQFDPAMRNVQPSGRSLTVAELVEPMFDAHGSNPSFQIEIRDFKLLLATDDLMFATYVEHQSGAKNSTPAENSRLSSAVFRESDLDGRLIWIHLDEVGLK